MLDFLISILTESTDFSLCGTDNHMFSVVCIDIGPLSSW